MKKCEILDCTMFQRLLLCRPEGSNKILATTARILRNVVHEHGLIDKKWLQNVHKKIAVSNRIKVGFGPLGSLCEGETTLGVRKYRIDPIVNYINEKSQKFVAGIFFGAEDMSYYDIIVIVKLFDFFEYSQIMALKKFGKKFVYDIVDNPCNYRPTRVYHDSPGFMKMMDYIISSSPLHDKDLQKLCIPIEMIEHPVINQSQDNHRSSKDDQVRIIWQGYNHNRAGMEHLHKIIELISKELKKDIKIIYHTNASKKIESYYEVWPWHICDWQLVLEKMDIGVVIKNTDDFYQKRKPSNKVLSYMAAGLPVICQPSPSDELVVIDGFNGFKVKKENDWHEYLKLLIDNNELRRQIGNNGRNFSQTEFSIDEIGDRYEKLFSRLI